ncbi:MAG: endonuclease/exonuclease/phosphatase family protein [Phycisphaerales bacterium]
MLAWIALCAAVALSVFTVLPWVRSGWWVVRVCDFPRAQLAALGVLGVLGAGVLLVMGLRNVPVWAALIVFGICTLVQSIYVVPFLSIWPVRVASANSMDSEQRLRVLVSNLYNENEQREELARWLERDDIDLLVLAEVDEEWMRVLGGVRERYEYRLEAVHPDGLGMALWSKLELSDATVEYLVSEDRPSLHARVRLRDGREIAVHAVHPAPPGLKEDDGERKDSRERDAELVLLAKRIADEPRIDRVVVGDLNDAAWSHTTRLFLRISGMLDPRVGRGMYSTYPATTPFFRYPIDHVFVSDGFRVHELRNERAPGSDHLAMFADISLFQSAGVSPEPQASDREDGAEMIEEGREDARE